MLYKKGHSAQSILTKWFIYFRWLILSWHGFKYVNKTLKFASFNKSTPGVLKVPLVEEHPHIFLYSILC